MSVLSRTGTDTRRGDTTVPDFETAQRRLFEAHGLEPRSRFIDLEGPWGRTQILEVEASDEAVPTVFVHGTAAFGAFFAPLMEHLDGVWMITFDRPGYGLSGPFVYTEKNVQRTVVDVLAGVLDELEIERADIVGHSMGGHTGILFALAHPDRVRRLALVGAVPAIPGTSPPLPIRLLTVPGLNRLLRWLRKPGVEGVLDIAEIFGERDAIREHPALIRAIAAHEDDPKAADAGFSEFNALLSLRGWRSSVRIDEDTLRAIEPPTTIIWGDHDTLGTPDDVRAGVGVIEAAGLETVAAGHIPFLSHPERCARLIQD